MHDGEQEDEKTGEDQGQKKEGNDTLHRNNELEMTTLRSSSQNEESTLLLFRNAPRDPNGASSTYRNFLLFSILFSAVPASALACLALATARLGSVGAWQSAILYLTYTLTAMVFSTAIVQRLGSRNGVILGQALFGSYVACFWIATLQPTAAKSWALCGAGLGGVGSAILWTAQGAYFTQASEVYSLESGLEWPNSTSLFSGIFAFCLLVEETILDLISTLLVRTLNVPWSFVFALYALVAILATLAMTRVRSYPRDAENNDSNSIWRKASAALDLLIRDSKMKYMIGFNAAFGFAGAFLNSFVSGEVVPVALQDASSSYVGLFVSVHGVTAALCSLIFGWMSRQCGKGPVLILGALAFSGVAWPFLLQPDLTRWTWELLLLIYSLEGVGRAVFEGTLKALFADYFPYQKEAGFANIILQNGLSSAFAYFLSVRLPCTNDSSPYCIEYRDGGHHNVGLFALMVVGTSLCAIVGYWRASCLAAVGNETLANYRRKSVTSYQSSRTLVSSLDRRTYQTLEAAIAQEEQREAQIEALAKIT